MTPALLDGR